VIPELGAYRISGHNGNFIPQAKACGFNHAYVGAGADAGDSSLGAEARAARLKALLKKLAAKGFKITLDLERHSPALGFKQVLKAAAPVWDSVTRIVLADEAPWLEYPLIRGKVLNQISALALSSRPLGAVFTPRQVLAGVNCAPLDFVGVEAYCDIPLTAPVPWKQVRELLHASVGKIPGRLVDNEAVLIVSAAYNRNGAFTFPTDILAVNEEAWGFASDRNFPLYAFAFGRSGGLKDLPFLRDWYAART
jgi:hypothetical protein